MSEKTLVPYEQKQVVFYEDEITAVSVLINNETIVYVPLRPIVEFLGVDWSSQYRRVRRDDIFKQELRSVVVTTTDRGKRETVCLPLEYLSGFLFGINASRVKPEIKERLLRYQRECHRVLSEAFQEGRVTADSQLNDLLQNDSPAAQAYKMAQAMMALARNQLLLEARLDTHSGRLDAHEERIEQLESTLGNPDRQISPEQAMQISQSVKSIAMAMGKKSGRNEYGGVYGEIYRRFGINSYKLLPRSQIEKAMAFLNDWLQSVAGDEPF